MKNYPLSTSTLTKSPTSIHKTRIKEVWRFVASDCGAYLPDYESVTIWHLRDLAAGKRKIIKCTDVKTIHVPQFEGLKIETMLEFA